MLTSQNISIGKLDPQTTKLQLCYMILISKSLDSIYFYSSLSLCLFTSSPLIFFSDLFILHLLTKLINEVQQTL